MRSGWPLSCSSRRRPEFRTLTANIGIVGLRLDFERAISVPDTSYWRRPFERGHIGDVANTRSFSAAPARNVSSAAARRRSYVSEFKILIVRDAANLAIHNDGIAAAHTSCRSVADPRAGCFLPGLG